MSGARKYLALAGAIIIMPFYQGCRVDEIAERNDKSAEIRINEKQKRDAYTREAIRELGEAIEEMRRDFRNLEDSFKKRRR